MAKPASDDGAYAHLGAEQWERSAGRRSTIPLAMSVSRHATAPVAADPPVDQSSHRSLTTAAPSDPDRLHRAIHGLSDSSPELSASTTLSRGQVVFGTVLVAGLVTAMFVAPRSTAVVLIALTTALYAVTLVYRIDLFRQGLHRPGSIVISDEEARAIPDDDLPTYTVLVPAFGEPEVIARTLAALDQLEYPSSRLDVKLLLEEDDHPTIEAAQDSHPSAHVEFVFVPVAQPRTKPKALNYGLFTARGSLVTIFDAEDRPEPLQLRRSVVAFARLDDRVACLQAKLAYFNADQNLITRWFAIEYGMWFSFFLPGLVHRSSPLPLGGTSNHFRREVLDEVGAWDPYNVTEDADLGIRLQRQGWDVRVLETTTYEEANSDFINWVKQRSRWYKGYLQTWLVHMRHPVRLWRDLGTRGFVSLNLFIAGTPLLALVNSVFWVLTLMWFVGRAALIRSIFPAPVYYAGLICWIFGNFMFVYANMVVARERRTPELVMAALLSPLYWVMMWVAAVKAVLQLVTAPSFWEKTSHGLDHPRADRSDDSGD